MKTMMASKLDFVHFRCEGSDGRQSYRQTFFLSWVQPDIQKVRR